jgi:pyruvate/2-oxoacid:ferredoxin oxidoreductase beta subunit
MPKTRSGPRQKAASNITEQQHPSPGNSPGANGYTCPGCGATSVVPNRTMRRAQRRHGVTTPPGAPVITHGAHCRHQTQHLRAELATGRVRTWLGGDRD